VGETNTFQPPQFSLKLFETLNQLSLLKIRSPSHLFIVGQCGRPPSSLYLALRREPADVSISQAVSIRASGVRAILFGVGVASEALNGYSCLLPLAAVSGEEKQLLCN